jgi:alpha-L-fucosidase
MIVKDYIKNFEKLGFGMFVHFGLYSVLGKGEWAKKALNINSEKYEKTVLRFKPAKDWAKQLVKTAKEAGCRYINLTARHHDGFSLYDTRGLSDFDTAHVLGRDLVGEFVDECNRQGVVPFLYHTTFDWHTDFFERDFEGYMKYLQASVEILCANYGKLGGIWFDGCWHKKADWQEDKLYGIIRKYQPDAMIINNTGLNARGEAGHIELDGVTFERGNPKPINLPDSRKYLGSEMCQVLNDHWGYAKDDLNYKSVSSLIYDFAQCRRYGANFLLNAGPMGNGRLRPIDREIFNLIGKWVKANAEALYLPRPAGIDLDGDDFILRNENTYYLFINNVPMSANKNVALSDGDKESVSFKLKENIKNAIWLDDGTSAAVEQTGGNVKVHVKPFEYGKSYHVRICRIEI